MSATLQVDHSDAIIEGSKYIVTGAENEKSSAELHENHPQEETVDKIKLDLETIQGDDALSEKAPRIPLSAMVMNGDNMKGGRDVSPKAAQSNEIEMEMDDDEIVDDDVCDDDDEEMEIDDTLVAMNAARDNAEQINQLDLDNIINQDTDHDDEGFTVHEHGDDDLEVECENCDRQRDMIERMQIELINSQEDTKAFEERYNSLQDEGSRLYEVYEVKCARLKELKNQNGKLEDDIGKVRENAENLHDEYEKIYSAYNDVIDSYAEVKEALADREEYINELSEEVAELKETNHDLINEKATLLGQVANLQQQAQQNKDKENDNDNDNVNDNEGEESELKTPPQIPHAGIENTASKSFKSPGARDCNNNDDNNSNDNNDDVTTHAAMMQKLQELVDTQEGQIRDLKTQLEEHRIKLEEATDNAAFTPSQPTPAPVHASTQTIESSPAHVSTQTIGSSPVPSPPPSPSLSLSPSPIEQEQEQEIASLRSTIGEANSNIAELTSDLQGKSALLESLTRELDEHKHSFSTQRASLAAAETQVRELSAKIKEMGQASADSLAEFNDNEEQQEAVSGQLKKKLMEQLQSVTITNEILRDEVETLEQGQAAHTEELEAVRAREAKLEAQITRQAVVISEKHSLIAQLEAQLREAALETAAHTTTKESLATTQQSLGLTEDDKAALQEQVLALTMELSTCKDALAVEQLAVEEKNLALSAYAENTEAADVNKASMETTIVALKEQLESEQSNHEDLRKDMLLLYKKHKKELKDLKAKYQHDDYANRYEYLAQENQVLRGELERALSVLEQSEEVDSLQKKLQLELDSKWQAMRNEKAVNDEVYTRQDRELRDAVAQNMLLRTQNTSLVNENDEVNAECDSHITTIELLHSHMEEEQTQTMTGLVGCMLAGVVDNVHSTVQTTIYAEELEACYSKITALSQLQDEVLQYQQALITKDTAHEEAASHLKNEIERLKMDKMQLEEFSNEEQMINQEISEDLENQVKALTTEKEELTRVHTALQGEMDAQKAQAAEDKEVQAMLNEELALANDKITAMTTELEDAQQQLKECEEQITYNQELIVNLEMKLASANELYTETQASLTGAENQVLSTTASLDQTQAELEVTKASEQELSQFKMRYEKARKELETAERILIDCQSNEASMKHELTKSQMEAKQAQFENDSLKQELESCKSQLQSCQRKAKAAIQSAEDDRLSMKEFEHSSKTHEQKCKTLENANRDLRLKLTEAQREQWERDQILDDFQKQKAAIEGRYKAVTQESDSQRKKSKHFMEQIGQLQKDLMASRKEVHTLKNENQEIAERFGTMERNYNEVLDLKEESLGASDENKQKIQSLEKLLVDAGEKLKEMEQDKTQLLMNTEALTRVIEANGLSQELTQSAALMEEIQELKEEIEAREAQLVDMKRYVKMYKVKGDEKMKVVAGQMMELSQKLTRFHAVHKNTKMVLNRYASVLNAEPELAHLLERLKKM